MNDLLINPLTNQPTKKPTNQSTFHPPIQQNNKHPPNQSAHLTYKPKMNLFTNRY